MTKIKTRKIFILLSSICLMIVALSLSACGGGGGGSTPIVTSTLIWDQGNWDQASWGP